MRLPLDSHPHRIVTEQLLKDSHTIRFRKCHDKQSPPFAFNGLSQKGGDQTSSRPRTPFPPIGDLKSSYGRRLPAAIGQSLLLERRFRQIVGRSVLDVIQDKRLESVCTLLRTTELPISEICASCSFGSGTYPLRLFKARMGMTMRAYRLASHT